MNFENRDINNELDRFVITLNTIYGMVNINAAINLVRLYGVYAIFDVLR
jgi:hypothetical protein